MKRHPKTPPTGQQLKAVIKRQPAVFTVYMVLRLIVLATLVSSILRIIMRLNGVQFPD